MFKKTIVVLLMFSIVLSSCTKTTEIIREIPVPAETPAPAETPVPVVVATLAPAETFVPTTMHRLRLTTVYLAVFHFSLVCLDWYLSLKAAFRGEEFDIADITPPSYLQSLVAGHLSDWTFEAYNFFNSNSSKKAVPANQS